VKRFYSIKLKHYKENIAPYTAKLVLTKESPLINYLKKNRALKWVHRKNRNLLEAYGEEKHLMIGKIKYPEMFGNKGRIGFMELYISHIINKRIMLAKGSS
jgi:hypothetical protein